MLSIEDAAAVLQCKPREVLGVEDHPAGTLVRTHDGNQMIVLDEPQDGAVVVWAVLPRPDYSGPVPLWEPPEEPEPAPVEKPPAKKAAKRLAKKAPAADPDEEC